MKKKYTVRLTEQELASLIAKTLISPERSDKLLGNFIKGVLNKNIPNDDSSDNLNTK
jgi:hypothetical protein